MATSKSKAKAKSRLPHMDDKTLNQIIAKLDEMRQESQDIINQNMQSDMKPREATTSCMCWASRSSQAT